MCSHLVLLELTTFFKPRLARMDAPEPAKVFANPLKVSAGRDERDKGSRSTSARRVLLPPKKWSKTGPAAPRAPPIPSCFKRFMASSPSPGTLARACSSTRAVLRVEKRTYEIGAERAGDAVETASARTARVL